MLVVNILILFKEFLMLIKAETTLDSKYLACKVSLALKLSPGSISKLISIGVRKLIKNLKLRGSRWKRKKRKLRLKRNKKNYWKRCKSQHFRSQNKISTFLWNSNLTNDHNQLNLSRFILSLSMQSSDIFGFLTPQQKNNTNSALLNSTNRSSHRGSSRRKPIFIE